MRIELFKLLVTLLLVLGASSSPPLARSKGPTPTISSIPLDPPSQGVLGPLPIVTKAATTKPTALTSPGLISGIKAVIVGEPIEPLSFEGSLWDLEPVLKAPGKRFEEIPAPREAYVEGTDDVAGTPQTFDLNRQTWHGEAPMPAPILDFPGVNNQDNPGFIVPPDSDGDVGPDHYIQMVNVTNRVYFKDGSPASPFFQLSQLWAAADPNDACASGDHGDPIVLYDPMADRWVMTQFYVPVPYYECVAVSKTSDPVDGGWWLYTITTHPTDFWDYPKVGVWPDAYFMTANMFPPVGDFYSRVMALERVAMLSGQPARTVTFDVSDGLGLLPASLRGNSPPPGSPGYLLEARFPNALRLYRFALDWNNPDSSTLTSTDLTVNPWNVACAATRQCVPQLGTTNRLDDISSRLMQPLHYRRIVSGTESIESLWTNHTIEGSVMQTVIRWYEIRDPGGTPTVHQQGTYEPDGTFRWMGSLATDKDGNMALGYSASSNDIYPQIRYAGRLLGDTLGILTQDERTLTAGTTYQDTWSPNPNTDARWGDYTAMSIDPFDDCTFWYTNQYYEADPGRDYEHYNWRTRIGTFKFPTCEPLPGPGWITGTVFDASSATLLGNAPISAVNQAKTRTYAGSTDASGYFTLTLLPGTYSVTAGPLPGYPNPALVSDVVVDSGATKRVDLGLKASPNLIEAGITITDPIPFGNANGYPEPGETYIQVWQALKNVGVANATNVSAHMLSLTPGVTVITDTTSYPDIVVGAVQTNTTPFSFAIDGSVACGALLDFRNVITSAQDVFSVTFSLQANIPGSGGQYISTDVPRLIPDNDTVVGTSSIVEVLESLTITDVNVSLSIAHTWDADLDIYIENPAATRVELSTDNGGGGDDYIGTIFDDEATTSITAGSPPFTRSYRPEQPLSTYDGTDAKGTWTLRVFDDTARFSGQVVTWTLMLQEGAGTPAHCEWPVLKWGKDIWIDGQMYQPVDSPFTVLSAEPITIVDRIWLTHTDNVTFSLIEDWTESLTLKGTAATGGRFTAGIGTAIWEVKGGAPHTWHVLTKTFEVVSGTGTVDYVTESLDVAYALRPLDDIVLEFRHPRSLIYLPMVLKNK